MPIEQSNDSTPDTIFDAGGSGVSQLLTMTNVGGHYFFSGYRNTDAILIGSRWTLMNQTFSFPTDGTFYVGYTTGENDQFDAFNPTQQAVVRYALSLVSSYCGLTFTEITETSTTHATHRFGQTRSSAVQSAQGHFPSSDVGAGDVWFGETNQPYYTTPGIGNWGYATILHEIGHTLGLKHGHSDYTTLDLSADLFVTSPRYGSQALEPQYNGQPYSLMTYQGGIGAPLTFQGDAYNQPQTYMMYDIAALQYMYGANYGTNNTNTVYTFSTTTGEMFVNGVSQGAPTSNRVFRTVWDGGGNDTYDLSNYWTNMSLDLEAGGWLIFDTSSSRFQRANNEPLSSTPVFAPGNVANALLYGNNIASLIENAIGGSGNDSIYGNRVGNTLTGNAGNDLLVGAGGNDTLYGGADNDTLYGDLAPAPTTGVGMGTGLVAHAYGNISTATAIDLTNTFSLASNADIENSTTWAHTTARMTTPSTGTPGASYYRITVNAGTTITLDIDHTTNVDTYIRIMAADGTTQLAYNDDNGSDTGSTSTLDSRLTYTFAAAGTYYIIVGRYSSIDQLPTNATYDLNVSVTTTGVGLGTTGAPGNDRLYGGTGNDNLYGQQGNDLLYDGSGTDALNGGGGRDYAVYGVASTAVTITRNSNGSVTVTGSGFSDTLSNVEMIAFTDRAVSIRDRTRTDLNGDDTSDLILRNGTTYAAWTIQNGSAVSSRILAVTGASDTIVGTGDFNGDGTIDMLLRNGNNIFAWTVNNGAVTQGNLMGTATGWNVVGTGDFNGDGTTDVLLQNGNQLAQWRVTNGVAGSSTTLGTLGAGWGVVGTGDFNGDGQTDILLQNGNTLAIWTVVNGHVTGGRTLGTLGAGWTVAGIGDFDGDGTSDVLLQNGSTLADWLVRNNGVASNHVIGTVAAGWNVVATGDYNGDGVADIALQNGDNIADWLMRGGVVVGSSGIGVATGYTTVA